MTIQDTVVPRRTVLKALGAGVIALSGLSVPVSRVAANEQTFTGYMQVGEPADLKAGTPLTIWKDDGLYGGCDDGSVSLSRMYLVTSPQILRSQPASYIVPIDDPQPTVGKTYLVVNTSPKDYCYNLWYTITVTDPTLYRLG